MRESVPSECVTRPSTPFYLAIRASAAHRAAAVQDTRNQKVAYMSRRQLERSQAGVQSTSGYEFCVGADFENSSGVHDDDAIGFVYGG